MAVNKRIRFEVFKRDGYRCRYCGATSAEARLTIDHLVPISLGGLNRAENLVVACWDCNSGKHDVPLDSEPMIPAVRDDAERWARAIEVCAQIALTDMEERRQRIREFDERWMSWSRPGSRLKKHRFEAPRPQTWVGIVDGLLLGGLPFEILLNCLDIAMSDESIFLNNVFRHTCKLARIELVKLHDRATVLAAWYAASEETAR